MSFKAFIFVIIFLITPLSSLALPQMFDSQKYDQLESRPAQLTSKVLHNKLKRVHDMINNERFDKALEFLVKLDQSSSRPFEKAQILQTSAYVHAMKGQHKKAIQDFKNSLALQVLPIGPTMMSLYSLAQMQIAQGEYAEGEKTLKEWFAVSREPSADAYILMATVYAETGRKKEALELVDHGISLSSEPKESWLQFSVALNFELKNFAAAAKSLKYLTGQFPQKKKYWKQLTGSYLNLERYDHALVVLELARKWGHLKEPSELSNLVSLFILQGYPYEAAQLMTLFFEKGLVEKSQKNWQILSQAWMQSEEIEKSLTPLGEAAKLSKDGQLWAQQGQLLLELERWKEASGALEKSLKKGSLKNPGEVYMILGVARYYDKNKGGARDAFEKAKGFAKTEKSAEQWLQSLL